MATPRKKKKPVHHKSAPDKARNTASEKAKEPADKQASKATHARGTTKKAARKKAKKKVNRAAAKKKSTRKTARRRMPARRKAAMRKAAAATDQTIHCTLAPTGSQSMVLPTSAIAEITDYAPPAPLDGTPDWLLGQMEWEDWQVPVISYGAMIDGETPETATGRSRIMVVKSLSNTARVPFIGVLVNEIPKLAKLTETDLEVTGHGADSPSVHCSVKMSGQKAVVPDLDRLSQLVAHAAYGTVDQEGSVAQV